MSVGSFHDLGDSGAVDGKCVKALLFKSSPTKGLKSYLSFFNTVILSFPVTSERSFSLDMSFGWM